MPIVFGFIILVLCSTCAIKMFSPPQTPQQVAAAKLRQEEDDAKRIAKELVRQKANLGSAAEFAPSKELTVIKRAEGVYDVAGYIQKGESGGKVRTNFSCTVKKNGYQWSLVKLTLPS